MTATIPVTSTSSEVPLAQPPKLRRRPALVAVSVGAVTLGALVSLWAYNSTANTHDVLAVRRSVDRGQVITAEDLVVVKIGVDPVLHPLPASAAGTVVGKRAALDMPAGGVVIASQVTDDPIPSTGNSVVGVALAPGMVPVDQVRVGDNVRVVSTAQLPTDPANQTPTQTSNRAADPADPGSGSTPAVVGARVVGISVDDSSGNTILNVEVPHAQAPALAAVAADGKAAVVLDAAGQ